MALPLTVRTAGDDQKSVARCLTQTSIVEVVLYALTGTYFGIVLTKSEVISWYRIQEMFRFQSFHMYGIIASAVVVAALSLMIIRRCGLRTIGGEAIVIPPKVMGRGYP